MLDLCHPYLFQIGVANSDCHWQIFETRDRSRTGQSNTMNSIQHFNMFGFCFRFYTRTRGPLNFNQDLMKFTYEAPMASHPRRYTKRYLFPITLHVPPNSTPTRISLLPATPLFLPPRFGNVSRVWSVFYTNV